MPIFKPLSSSSSVLVLSDRVYRLLLRAYPLAFRRRYGDEMALVFRDCCRDALRNNGLAVLSLWIRTLGDYGLTLVSQRLTQILSNTHQEHSIMTIDTPTFDRQLGNTIKSFSVLLRSGYSVRQSFSMIGDKAPEPTATVFKHVVEKLDAGTDAQEVFNALKAHVPSSHLGVVLDTMLRQRQEGGNLADKLDPIAENIMSEAGQDPASSEVLQSFCAMMSSEDESN